MERRRDKHTHPFTHTEKKSKSWDAVRAPAEAKSGGCVPNTYKCETRADMHVRTIEQEHLLTPNARVPMNVSKRQAAVPASMGKKRPRAPTA